MLVKLVQIEVSFGKLAHPCIVFFQTTMLFVEFGTVIGVLEIEMSQRRHHRFFLFCVNLFVVNLFVVNLFNVMMIGRVRVVIGFFLSNMIIFLNENLIEEVGWNPMTLRNFSTHLFTVIDFSARSIRPSEVQNVSFSVWMVSEMLSRNSMINQMMIYRMMINHFMMFHVWIMFNFRI